MLAAALLGAADLSAGFVAVSKAFVVAASFFVGLSSLSAPLPDTFRLIAPAKRLFCCTPAFFFGGGGRAPAVGGGADVVEVARGGDLAEGGEPAVPASIATRELTALRTIECQHTLDVRRCAPTPGTLPAQR